MTKNLNRTEMNLINLGHQSLLERLLSGPLPIPVQIKLQTGKQAKQLQRLLYQWTWFYPEVKSRISITLISSEMTGYHQITIFPKGLPERRGRKGAKLG